MKNVKSLHVVLKSKIVAQLEALYFDDLGWVIQFCKNIDKPLSKHYFILNSYVVDGTFAFMLIQKKLTKTDYLQFATVENCLEFMEKLQEKDFDVYINSKHKHPLQQIMENNHQM